MKDWYSVPFAVCISTSMAYWCSESNKCARPEDFPMEGFPAMVDDADGPGARANAVSLGLSTKPAW